MTKFLITLGILAAAVVAFRALAPDSRRAIGDPVLSLSPSAAASRGPAATFTDGTYVLVPASSSMRWEGTRPLIKGYLDSGTVALASGTATVLDGRVTGGSITVDLTSIAATATGKGVGADALSKHLKSDDFFDVQRFPSGSFTLTALTPTSGSAYEVKGTLTLKGVTNAVAFAATVVQDGNLLTMTAPEVTLDRTLWGITYGSGTFFKEIVGDKLIADTFTVSFTAVGRRR
jgi:polyisoprenoid-binding protein YceI